MNPSKAVAKKHIEQLTQRERQILYGIVAGRKYVEIGRTTGLTHLTIKTYVAKLRKKLKLHSRSDLAVWAVRNGVVK